MNLQKINELAAEMASRENAHSDWSRWVVCRDLTLEEIGEIAKETNHESVVTYYERMTTGDQYANAKGRIDRHKSVRQTIEGLARAWEYSPR